MQLLPADIEFCVKTICKELVTLSSEDINQMDSKTLRVIFGEIYGKKRRNPRDSVNLKVPILATVRNPLCNTRFPPTPSPPCPAFRCAAVARVAFTIRRTLVVQGVLDPRRVL